jgi:hypothetical protein
VRALFGTLTGCGNNCVALRSAGRKIAHPRRSDIGRSAIGAMF